MKNFTYHSAKDSKEASKLASSKSAFLAGGMTTIPSMKLGLASYKDIIDIKGIKNNRAIAIGPFNLQVTRLYVENVINECLENKILSVDILGFEFEMGLFPNIRDIAGKQGIDLNCLYIPNDIFDKKAVKKSIKKGSMYVASVIKKSLFSVVDMFVAAHR